MQRAAIPSFYLYGEPRRSVDPRFVHVESLDDRSRPSEWTIRPHTHAELNHVFLISDGGGTMRADGGELRFAAPVMLLVPAGCVHGFAWSHESRGWVATIAQAELRALVREDPDFTDLFVSPRALVLSAADAAATAGRMARLARELGWRNPGQRTALRAALLDLLLIALRNSPGFAGEAALRSPQAELVARFRERVEQRFRMREPVATHAAALGTSESALRAACARVCALSPAAMLDTRALSEAKRVLIYSNLTVAEIGYSLGFSDPAYFSRFFSRHAGCSPRAFRLHSASGDA